MFKGLKQRLDAWAIRMACATLPNPNPRPNQLEEAKAILGSPEFLRLPEIPARVRFLPGHQFTFASARSSPWEVNNVVPGALFPAGDEWRQKPLVLLLHGWNAELQYRHELPLVGRGLARRGINGAMLQLPFHGDRRPRRPAAVRNFISDDLPVMLEATRQALGDIQSFLLWARSQGCPLLGLWGFSFGAWLAGLHLCSSDLEDIAVLTTPISSMEEAISGLPFCESIRRALGGASLDLSRLNLTAHQPRIDSSRILITQAEYDLFVPGASLEALEKAWKQPLVWRVPHSHISVLLSVRSFQRVIRWCAEEFEAGRREG